MIPSESLLASVLGQIREGRDHARKGSDIAVSLGITRLRTIGEAVAVLRELGIPISSTAADGYWRATTAEELEASLRESRRRALSALRQHRSLRTALATLRGQTTIPEVAP